MRREDMSRPMVKKSDGGEYHNVLNGKNSQLQKTREAQETTPVKAQDRNLRTLEGGEGARYLQSTLMRCLRRCHFRKVIDRYSCNGRF